MSNYQLVPVKVEPEVLGLGYFPGESSSVAPIAISEIRQRVTPLEIAGVRGSRYDNAGLFVLDPEGGSPYQVPSWTQVNCLPPEWTSQDLAISVDWTPVAVFSWDPLQVATVEGLVISTRRVNDVILVRKHMSSHKGIATSQVVITEQQFHNFRLLLKHNEICHTETKLLVGTYWLIKPVNAPQVLMALQELTAYQSPMD